MSIQASMTKLILRGYFNYLLRQPYRDQRQIQEQFSRFTARIAKDVSFEPVDIAGLPAEWVRTPQSDKGRAILYFHGGAYFAGSIATHRDIAARLAGLAGARVLLVGYRLAPEHPYPAALEDALAAYRWLLAQGLDPNKVILAGDSAGGGLALATLVSLRDVGDPLPAGAVCISPWVDLMLVGESMERNAKVDMMCKPWMLQQSVQWYAGECSADLPQISPLYADLRDLPPILIHVGTEETLLDDSIRLAERARAAGVEVDLHVWPKMFHMFPLVGYMPESKQALAIIQGFIEQRMK